MSRLILLRHGQSTWNEKNIFTGWVDIPLSEKGVQEAFAAGEAIKDIPIDVIYTSSLIRGIMTAMLAMLKHQSQKIPVILHPGEGKLEEWATFDESSKEFLIPVLRASELNERMYGDLQGKNKQKMRDLYGDEQVHIWRRSYDVAPPRGESLKDTAERTLPYFEKEILPLLYEGKNVLISAHGNSLRSIVKHIEHLSPEEIVGVEIPTGQPLVYTCDPPHFSRIHYERD